MAPMNFEELTRKLSQQAQKKPCPNCPKSEPGLEDRIIDAGKAKASMLAIWTINPDGTLAYSCHRDNFPVDDLQRAADQFSKDQFEEYVRSIARGAVK
jgi:hypothetical protein